jgi:hypothetical protein
MTLGLFALTAGVGRAAPLTENSTQPEQLIEKLKPPAECARCHQGPMADWSGGIMGNDFRDPSFLALLSISEQDSPGIGDLCLRCHAAGWWEGKSHPPGGDPLGRSFEPPPKIDQESVPLCDFCHGVERVGMRESRYDGRAMAEAEGAVFLKPERGEHPGGPDRRLAPLHQEGEFCGSCHDVSNPAVRSLNDKGLPHPLERTYTEWKFSSAGEEGRTCQECHPPMKFPGAQTWMLDPGMSMIYPDIDAGWADAGYEVSRDRTAAWAAARERNESFMRQAASVQMTAPERLSAGADAALKVTVVNNTGHRLPTGFAEGRQMWIHVKVTDQAGDVVFEDGQLDDRGSLVRTAQTKVYEQQAGVDGDKSLNFALLNTILKDNRIPPAGFNKEAYEAEGAFIIGADYADGQNWDETEYSFEVPATADGPFHAEATLKYETFSYEFVNWLKETDKTLGSNHGGPAAATPEGFKTWGEVTYWIWDEAAKGRPVAMASAAIELPVLAGAGWMNRPRAGALAVVLLGAAFKLFKRKRGKVTA